MEHYFIFSDEAGVYERDKSKKFLEKNPFYVRSNVAIEVDDYFEFQKSIKSLNKTYDIPETEEVKWEDVWGKKNKRHRAEFLKALTLEDLKQYIEKVIAAFSKLKKGWIVVTVTDNRYVNAYKEKILKMHLQNAYQRVQMEFENKAFAMFILDEMDQQMLEILKIKSHSLVTNGDMFVKYKNVFPSLLVEHSNLCVGIQLADYVAGAVNGCLKKRLLEKPGYDFADELYFKMIYPKIRCSDSFQHFGYGIMEIPTDQKRRKDLYVLDMDIDFLK